MIEKVCAMLLAVCPLHLVAQESASVIHSVQEAVSVAERNSQAYRLQKESALLNMQNAAYSITPFLPQLEIAWSESDASNKASPDSRSKNIVLSATQTVFNGGKNMLAYNMAKYSAAYQYESYMQSLQSFKASVIQQYYSYMIKTAEVEIRKNLVANAEQQLAICKSEYEHGIRLENDYLEYIVDVMRLRDELKKVERDARMLLRACRITLGGNVESDITLERVAFPDEVDDMALEPHASLIWHIIKNNNFELKKERMNLYYSRKQLEYARRVYVPEVSLTGSISFSGVRYPLTEPSYSIKVNISFANNPFFPLQTTHGYGFSAHGLNSVSNTASASLVPLPAYFITKKLEHVSLAQQLLAANDSEISLQESVFSMIAAHDDYIDSIARIRDTLHILERRLEISKLEVEKGERTRIEYLEALEKYAEEKINLAQAQCNLVLSSHELELLADIPLGGLKHALAK